MSNDGVVKFWDVRTKNCVNEVKGLGDAFTLTWDPEGESLIVGNKVNERTAPTPLFPRSCGLHPMHTKQYVSETVKS